MEEKKFDLKIVLIALLGMIVVFLGVYFVYNEFLNKETPTNNENKVESKQNEEEKENKTGNLTYELIFDNNKVNIISKNSNGKETIEFSYECKDNDGCFDATGIQGTLTYKNNTLGRYLIYDNMNSEKDSLYILLDAKKGIIGSYKSIDELFYLNNYYFIVSSNNKYGLIDEDGNYIYNLEYNEIASRVSKGILQEYSYDSNVLRLVKNGKSGLGNINKNNIVLDLNYDYIYIINNKLLLIKSEDGYYLCDYAGNKLDNQKIEIDNKYNNVKERNIHSKIDNNKLYIEIDDSDFYDYLYWDYLEENDNPKYEFDISNY